MLAWSSWSLESSRVDRHESINNNKWTPCCRVSWCVSRSLCCLPDRSYLQCHAKARDCLEFYVPLSPGLPSVSDWWVATKTQLPLLQSKTDSVVQPLLQSSRVAVGADASCHLNLYLRQRSVSAVSSISWLSFSMSSPASHAPLQVPPKSLPLGSLFEGNWPEIQDNS